jgi:hypothetical protein
MVLPLCWFETERPPRLFLVETNDLGRMTKEQQTDLCVVKQGAWNARAKMFSNTFVMCMVEKLKKSWCWILNEALIG